MKKAERIFKDTRYSCFKHIQAGKKIRVAFRTLEVFEPFAGSEGMAATVETLLGDDSDLIDDIQLLDEPAESGEGTDYIVAHYPVSIDETMYYAIKAKDNQEADALAYSMTHEGSAGGEYDLYRRI